MCRIRRSYVATLPSEWAKCTCTSRSRPDGSDDAWHRRREASLDVRNEDVETCAEKVFALVRVKIDLGVDRHVGRKLDLLSLRRDSKRAFETGRPAGGEQLLRISARARRSGRRYLDVEPAV